MRKPPRVARLPALFCEMKAAVWATCWAALCSMARTGLSCDVIIHYKIPTVDR